MSWPGFGRQERDFEDAVLVHLDVLYRGALRLSRNRADAEDLVQETVTRALRRFDQFHIGTNGRAWLFRIMRNLFLNRVRADRERPREGEFFEERIGSAEAARVVAASPEEEFLQTVVHGDVDRALGTLPPSYREVVVFRDIEGFTYREIAEALECPIGTVMSRLSRGRALLRVALDALARERGYREP